MTLLSGPVFSSIQHKGYQYQQMRHTNVAIVSTISVYAVQFPQSIATYLKKVPWIQVEDQNKTQTRNQYVKHASQTKKASKCDLALR